MGKFVKAFKKYRKEQQANASAEPLKKEDWDALLQYNRQTGRLNLHSTKIIKNPDTIYRLLANKMILSDGTLTKSAKQKCEKNRNELRIFWSGNHEEHVNRENEIRKPVIAADFVELRDSDLEFLMTYDRETGHLLRYDEKTGRLKNSSLEILKENGIFKRLLSSKMIDPKGKLTPSGIKKCAESSRKFKITGGSNVAASDQDKDIRQNIKIPTEYEDLRESDWAALMEYDRSTGNLLKYDPETGQLDNPSRQILKDPDLVQRLIDKNMIISGGWLTAEAKRECEKREQKLKNIVTDRSIEQYKQENKITTPHVMGVIKKIGKTEKNPKAADSKPLYKEEFESKRATPEKQERPFDAPQKLYDKTPVDIDLVSLLEPQSFEAEQFKLLKTNLLYPSSGNAPRSILVTGPSPGEGKTFVAANLAVSVALNIDKYVLLMDCDLRRPAIHKRFGFGKVPGLSEYLSKETSLHSLLLKTKVDRLTILPGGTPPLNPSELMSSERMSTLVEEVTNRYSDRLIIIDSPPSPLTAETGVIARHVDGIVLVLRYRKTNENALRKIIEKLGKENILGCVVNYLEASSIGYYGYRNYDKYRSYYWGK